MMDPLRTLRPIHPCNYAWRVAQDAAFGLFRDSGNGDLGGQQSALCR